MADNPNSGNGAGEHFRLGCPCCGARLRLEGEDGAARLVEAEPSRTSFTAGTMFIDPHAHMIARTTDDYEAMARAPVLWR
jgi:hypothetical protein